MKINLLKFLGIRKISVTQSDIDNGFRKDCTKCPIALAIAREFKTDIVNVQLVYLAYKKEYEGKIYKHVNTPVLRSFIRMFDEGKYSLKPFNFYLFSV